MDPPLTASDEDRHHDLARDVRGGADMLALAGLTSPAPFLPRTIQLGVYLGIRRRGTAFQFIRAPG
ncbi:hypothetical protein [Nonomuraea fuscirosea]|uniref:hypothetical protein n=1 Tax=Nonomuraea fuscirosea TaxID=1291556 RepID=UPI00343FCB89